MRKTSGKFLDEYIVGLNGTKLIIKLAVFAQVDFLKIDYSKILQQIKFDAENPLKYFFNDFIKIFEIFTISELFVNKDNI